MTENERMSISGLLDVLNTGIAFSTCHMEYAIQSNVLEDLIGCLEELDQYRAIGTVEDIEKGIKQSEEEFDMFMAYRNIGTIDEFKALKEKNTPMELAEHNFQDEVHHYLCPSCRNIVNCNQNYCEECGQALET